MRWTTPYQTVVSDAEPGRNVGLGAVTELYATAHGSERMQFAELGMWSVDRPLDKVDECQFGRGNMLETSQKM